MESLEQLNNPFADLIPADSVGMLNALTWEWDRTTNRLTSKEAVGHGFMTNLHMTTMFAGGVTGLSMRNRGDAVVVHGVPVARKEDGHLLIGGRPNVEKLVTQHGFTFEGDVEFRKTGMGAARGEGQ